MNTASTEPAITALSSYRDAALTWAEAFLLPEVSTLILGAASLLLLATLLLLRQRNRLLQAQRARNNAESLASSLFDALPDAAFITDPSGRFLSVNPVFCALTGKTERELSTLGLRDVFPPLVAERLEYRAVESDEEEPETPLALHFHAQERFLPIKTPLFDTHGMLIGVLVQLRPASGSIITTPAPLDCAETTPEDDPGLLEALQIAVKVSQASDNTGAADGASRPVPPQSTADAAKPNPHGYRLFEVIPGTEAPSRKEQADEKQHGRDRR